MSYQARIAVLENVRRHPNADKIALATCLGSQVVVGLDARDGDVMVFFDSDGQLSEAYCQANDLVRYTDPETGEVKGGYFDSKRRVRAQTFRGAKSEAYVTSLESLMFAEPDLSKLTVGSAFQDLNGVPICNKYVTPETLKAARFSQPKQPKLNVELRKLFPEHFDTAQLRHARDEELTGLVTITAKLHGSSQRSALLKVPVEKKQGWLAKLLHLTPKSEEQWLSVYGTRRVIKGEATERHTDYRANCHRLLQPHINKGEIWYYEIVGYEDTGAPIMQTVDCSKMGKEFVEQFGKSMTYKYGCLPEKCDVYVYRIVTENEDGVCYELPWGMVKNRCRLAGIKHVPEVESSFVTDCPSYLRQRVEDWVEKTDISDSIDPSHVREGVCVRIDNIENGQCKILKLKSFCFRVLEGIVKDSGVVDTEEVEAEVA